MDPKSIDIHFTGDIDRISSAIRDKADRLGVAEEVASVVVAADNDVDYGNCIKRSKGFLGGGTHTVGGVGKTLPFRNDDGSVVCDLVFPRRVFDILLHDSKESEDYLLMDYVVAHELAHCCDYARRRTLHPMPLANYGAPIEQLASHWGPIVLSEFAASFGSAPLIDAQQFGLIADNAVRLIEKGMTSLGTFRLQIYWNVLVEEAKIAGSSIGAPGLGKPEFRTWARIGPNVIAEIKSFTVELRELKAAYPKWPESETNDLLTRRCLSLFASMK